MGGGRERERERGSERERERTAVFKSSSGNSCAQHYRLCVFATILAQLLAICCCIPQKGDWVCLIQKHKINGITHTHAQHFYYAVLKLHGVTAATQH